jgi:hypothetical protein
MNEDLATPYHQQDTGYYCGAACAQMVLAAVGVGIQNQDDLYNDNHSHSTTEPGWATAPDGLQWTLNHDQASKYFALDALMHEDAISRMIAWTIHHYQVAPIALVFGSAHWIAVRGYDASAAPTSSIDTSYTITGFEINNPWPPTPAPAPPPPHAAGDLCGTGGTRGVADEHIAYATWVADYMTGCDFGHWNGRFVAVCDPDPPATRLPSERSDVRRRGESTRLIEPAAAVSRAMTAPREVGLLQRPRWSEALTRIEPAEPILVQRLDRLDSFYYIVPVARERAVTAAVSVDARFGEYRQAIALPKPSPDAFRVLDEESTLRRVLNQRFELTGAKGRLLVREEAVCVYPTYVWRPCRESLSPFYPFRMVTVGDDRLFIRIDGPIFTSLTLGLHGI